MKSPLLKRLPRELRSELGKYVVIFLLMIGTIGLVSGFLVADGSMLEAYNSSFTVYNVEDGHFRTQKEMNKAQRKAVNELGITVYDNYYVEQELTNGSKLRIFDERTEVNLVCLMEGALPAADREIAIDRMYADNTGVSIGDTLTASDGTEWKVTGLVALSDYSTMYESNDDAMFDATMFGVAVVSAERFDQFEADEVRYCYAWKYDTAPADEAEEKQVSDDLMEALTEEVHLEDFVPQYLNNAINFTGEDMGSDRIMAIALLYIIIVILAFVFGVTVNNTVVKEANVIGTLRASGYTRGELVRHYMTVPLFVTLVSALIGNILGYTAFKDLCVLMYYNSYSLPTFVTVWSAEAFVLTTVVPIALMAVITFFMLNSRMRLSPLKFLRRDLSGRKQKKVMHLGHRIPFFARFRLRVIFQNRSNYILMFVGILFANFLLMFGLVFPSVMNHYANTIADQMLADYQYMLTIPIDITDDDHKLDSMFAMLEFSAAIETENEDAEEFSVYSLKTMEDTGIRQEEVTLYGVREDSAYIPLDFSGGQIYISSAYAEKYGYEIGDTFTLTEAYEDTDYTFTVGGIYDYEGAICVFMEQNELNRLVDYEDDFFCGYFSSSEITDIDEQYIGTVIDLTAMTKLSRQMDTSMGQFMYIVDVFAMIMFVVLIYLLSKIVIEKNAQSISMSKILGYTNREITRLYIVSTSIVVVLSILISLPLIGRLMKTVFRMMMMEMITGWIPLEIDPVIYAQIIGMGIATYAIVAVIEFRRIHRVRLDVALKNVE